MFVIAKHTDKSGMRGHGEKIRKGKDKRMVSVVVDLYIYICNIVKYHTIYSKYFWCCIARVYK